MKHSKIIFILLLAFACLAPLTGQTRSTLAVLPFTGTENEDGKALALLFEDYLQTSFRVVSRNDKITGKILKEQHIQRSGLTDSDTISQLGKQLNAQFVLAGHIQKLGNKNLVFTTVVNVETLQQIAGDFKEYGRIDEVINFLPEMAKHIETASKTDSRGTPRLAVLPFDIPSNVAVTDAEALAQLLATEIANSGKYAVLPRTKTIDAALKELNIQRSGLTDVNTIKAVGKALNADYVLAGSVLKVGSTNVFSAKIIDITSAEQFEGRSIPYTTMEDGLKFMPRLSETLTGVESKNKIPDTKVKKSYTPKNYGHFGIGFELAGLYSGLQLNTANLPTGGFMLRLLMVDLLSDNFLVQWIFFEYSLSTAKTSIDSSQILYSHFVPLTGIKLGHQFDFFNINYGLTFGFDVFSSSSTMLGPEPVWTGFVFTINPLVGIQFRFTDYIAITAEYKISIPFSNTSVDLRHNVSLGLNISTDIF